MSKEIRGVYEHPRNSNVWWIQYFANGRRHREKVGKKSWAIKAREARKAAILMDKFFPTRGSATVEELVRLTFDDYRINKRKLEPIESCWKRLEPFFAKRPSGAVTTQELRDYLSSQSSAGYSNGSLNRDMALLKRSFRLALEMTPPKIGHVPIFPARLKEAPPRSGFIDEPQFIWLLENAGQPWLKAFLAIAYRCGLRKQEILDLRVYQVEENFIRLNPGETKNGEGRIVPLTEEMRELLAPCLRGKSPRHLALSRGTWHGPVLDFRGAWTTLAAAAGVPGLLVHDLRRSAVRNMVNRGVPEKVAMAISGHKTRTVFDRYNIVSEAEIVAAGEKLERANHRPTSPNADPAPGQETRKPTKIISIAGRGK